MSRPTLSTPTAPPPRPAAPGAVLPAFVFATPLPLQCSRVHTRLHAHHHRRRSSPASFPRPVRRRAPARIHCSAAPGGGGGGTGVDAPNPENADEPASAVATGPDNTSPEQRFATRLATARDRARLLHFRLLERLADAAVAEAETALDAAAGDASGRASAAAARRLRRDLRLLRSSPGGTGRADATVAPTNGADAADAAPAPKPEFYVAAARLQSLVEELERRADADPSYSRERLQEQLESPTRGAEDVLSDSAAALDGVDGEEAGVVGLPDGGLDAADGGSPAPLDAIRRRGEDVRRTVSDVGSAIEGTVSEFVRDDGSIDVDGLRGWVRRLLDAVAMTWMRLNGRTPPSDLRGGAATGSKDGAGAGSPAAAQATEVPGQQAVQELQEEPEPLRDERKEYLLREEIGALEKQLNESSKKREQALRREDQLGKLMRAKELRQMDDAVSALRRTLAVRVLQLELEKVYVCLGDDVAAAAYDAIVEQRVVVAEFGALDERLATLDLFIDQDEPLLIKDDVLGDLAADIQDMKLRLGIDDPLYSSADLSWTQVRQFLLSSSAKAREGAEFYYRGLRLFAGDVRFALRLIRRAVLGYTPSPREVRTLRRTGRDLLTLIPFTIVLIAPLTPVGHVLIFSFLQRYWPEFFPSTFSERRQAMMKRHEQYMKVLDADAADAADDADDEPGAAAGGAAGDDGGGGRAPAQEGGGVPAMLAPLRDMLQFGRPAEDDARRRNGDDEDDAPGSGGRRVGALKREIDAADNEAESESVGVGIQDLAESVRGSEAVARKKRGGLALDELHLAD